MKFKVISFAPPDGIIIANKNNIACVPTIHDKNGDPIKNPKIGDVEDSKNMIGHYWWYTRKEFEKIYHTYEKSN